MRRLLLAADFDVLAVVWALALGLAFMWVCLAQAPMDRSHWATAQAGPPWIVQAEQSTP
ncbi:MAG: hypothetical protein ACXWMU_06435 [Candidatus Limnocylindrales bacterium]